MFSPPGKPPEDKGLEMQLRSRPLDGVVGNGERLRRYSETFGQGYTHELRTVTGLAQRDIPEGAPEKVVEGNIAYNEAVRDTGRFESENANVVNTQGFDKLSGKRSAEKTSEDAEIAPTPQPPTAGPGLSY